MEGLLLTSSEKAKFHFTNTLKSVFDFLIPFQSSITPIQSPSPSSRTSTNLLVSAFININNIFSGLTSSARLIHIDSIIVSLAWLDTYTSTVAQNFLKKIERRDNSKIQNENLFSKSPQPSTDQIFGTTFNVLNFWSTSNVSFQTSSFILPVKIRRLNHRKGSTYFHSIFVHLQNVYCIQHQFMISGHSTICKRCAWPLQFGNWPRLVLSLSM